MTLVRTLVGSLLLAALCAGPALAQAPDGGALEVPGEGLSGSLLPAEPSGASAGAADAGGLPFRFSEEELRAQSLLRPSGEPQVAADLPPIYIQVSTVVYEKVAYVVQEPVAPRHRRRSMASRGASAAPAPSTRSVTRYRTVARRSKSQVDISPIIEKYARKYDLDPWLIRAVIEVESAFRPYAVSPAGAGGLMQLMPATAAGLGCRDRFDHEANIAAGARYLRLMLDKFGSQDLAIAAYNAGPGNVQRYGGIPPFAETQRYVVKVRRAWERGRQSGGVSR